MATATLTATATAAATATATKKCKVPLKAGSSIVPVEKVFSGKKHMPTRFA